MRAVFVAVIAFAVAAAANGGAESLRPAHFAARPGWHVGNNRVHSCVGVPQSQCSQVESWAATIRFRDCGNCVPPHKTLVSLPPTGISIQLILGWERKRLREPAFSWPPRIRTRDVVGPIEGGPQNVGSVQKSGRIRGFSAYLWVFFGRRHPSAAQVARANAELGSATLP
jgi:hypothetical protein